MEQKVSLVSHIPGSQCQQGLGQEGSMCTWVVD